MGYATHLCGVRQLEGRKDSSKSRDSTRFVGGFVATLGQC